MIISRTPYRVSLFGGGTDYPSWYEKYGGQVLAVTINKYIYISCRVLPPFFEHRLRFVYTKAEVCQSARELEHPSAREILAFMGIDNGLEIHYDGDLPGRSGLGSSSVFSVGLLNALNAYKGRIISKKQLAEQAIHVEQNLIKEVVGSQDQISASYGGVNRIIFDKQGQFFVNPLTISSERLAELEKNMMLFFTGIVRTSTEIAGTYIENLEQRMEQFNKLYELVNTAVDILGGSGSVDKIGELLHQTWMEKRKISSAISNEYVDDIYRKAIEAGAIGGKLAGAGGGGFLILYVPIEKQGNVREKLSHLVHVPFNFEYGGSQIVYYDHTEMHESDQELQEDYSTRRFLELSDLK